MPRFIRTPTVYHRRLAAFLLNHGSTITVGLYTILFSHSFFQFSPKGLVPVEYLLQDVVTFPVLAQW